MAKINVTENAMAMFMVLEGIGENRKDFDYSLDENGCCDITITFNGKEIDVERFLEQLHRSYSENIRKEAADLIEIEYGRMLDSIYSIQEALQHQDEIFENRVYGINIKK